MRGAGVSRTSRLCKAMLCPAAAAPLNGIVNGVENLKLVYRGAGGLRLSESSRVAVCVCALSKTWAAILEDTVVAFKALQPFGVICSGLVPRIISVLLLAKSMEHGKKDNVLIVEYPASLVLQLDISGQMLIRIIRRHCHNHPAAQLPLQSAVAVSVVQEERRPSASLS